MLSKHFSRLDEECRPVLRRFLGEREVTHVGGCPCGENMTLRVELPRTLGAAAVVLRVIRDGDADRDFPLSFVSTCEGIDRSAVLGAAVPARREHPVFKQSG